MIKIKLPILFLLVFITLNGYTQKIETIYANLYTDSLKKGTFNYINIDGLLSNGKYIPLDSTEIVFWASEGKFSGNNLWIDKDFKNDKVLIKAVLKGNPQISREFTLYIKRKPDNEILKTSEAILNEMSNSKKNKKKYK